MIVLFRKINDGVAAIRYGKAKPEDSGGKIPVVGSSGVYGFTDRPLVAKPTIVVGRKGTAGMVYYFDTPIWPSDTVFYLEINTDKLDSKFLYYYLSSKKLSGKESQTTLPSLKREDLENIEVPCLVLPTQQKIVKILDSIQAEIGAQKEIIERTKELKQALMNKMLGGAVGDKSIKLEAVCYLRREQRLANGNDVYIGLEHIDPGENKIVRFGNGDEVVSLKNKFHNNDILYGKLRPYLDKVAKVNFEGVCSTDILVIQCNDNKILPQYLVYILHKDNFLNYAQGNMSGTNHPRISWNAIKKFIIDLPSIAEQKEIASILEKADERIEVARKQKQLYEELFSVTLNKLMKGEIEVENVNI